MNLHIRYSLWTLSSAIMLTLAWYPFPVWPLAFVGFVPILMMEDHAAESNQKGWFRLYTYLAMLAWNLGTTWWVWNASEAGAIAAFMLNSLFMSVPWFAYTYTKPFIGNKKAGLLLASAWISYELLHLNWELSWPWLVLGNVFAPIPDAVQWYEYTGHLGGSVWVWWVNLSLFHYIKNHAHRTSVQRLNKGFNLAFTCLVIPLFISWYVYHGYESRGIRSQVVVVQPNIDPYTEKFSGKTPFEQLTHMLHLADSACDSSVSLVCFPETALVDGLNENELERESSIWTIRNWQLSHPGLSVLSGADTYRIFPKENRTLTSRPYNESMEYDAFNTALLFPSDGSAPSAYHKSKLVPGVEKMPYPQVFGFLEKMAINLGGTSGSLGSDPEPRNLKLNAKLTLAPVICYESVYGDYVRKYVEKGAQLICIITNDGWWGNTPGYRQHFQYARLRAIENRRYVARSANTGISGFIDDRGHTLQATDWWVPDARKQEIIWQDKHTFYTTHGDYLGWFAVFICIILLVRAWQHKKYQVW